MNCGDGLFYYFFLSCLAASNKIKKSRETSRVTSQKIYMSNGINAVLYCNSFFLYTFIFESIFFTLVGWAGGERGETRNAQMRFFSSP
jgi:hypothetical protein